MVFRMRSEPTRRVVGLGRLPFGSKYSPFICQMSLARIVQKSLPPYILLVHYLDLCTTIKGICGTRRVTWLRHWSRRGLS